MALLAVVAAFVVLALATGSTLLGGQPGDASPSPTSIAAASQPAETSPAGSARPSPRATHSPSPSATPASPSPSASSEPPLTPSPSPTHDPKSAPQSAADFDLEGQVVDICFPLRTETHYHYRDNFLDPRAGAPDDYNHARQRANGNMRRLHDGIDIYGPEGAPVVAPFSGHVVDPAARWTPWEPDRYGLTVVIESDEPTSLGYTAVLVHLEKVWVDIGQQVGRGQVIGVLGRTGNAQKVDPQLHFELRAPFPLDWSSFGEERLVDAFNPYPSLIAVDPHR